LYHPLEYGTTNANAPNYLVIDAKVLGKGDCRFLTHAGRHESVDVGQAETGVRKRPGQGLDVVTVLG
jgi:hypothetical protein